MSTCRCRELHPPSSGDHLVLLNEIDTGRAAPTGKTVTCNEIFVIRFANRRIAQTWGVVDIISRMRQLGVIPA